MHTYDVIIIGGSYAGLSTAMTLGRASRNTLILDAGKPCNRQTPHSHNFITQDGQTPAAIAALARQQVGMYPTVTFQTDTATQAQQTENGFTVSTASGLTARARKLVFATGITDQLPSIPGFAECWGISVLHCPYCHGYEVRNEPLGMLANGNDGFEFAKLLHQWSPQLTVFTNGPASFTPEQLQKLTQRNIRIEEGELIQIHHQNGYLTHLEFVQGKTHAITALFARVPFTQHSHLPAELGCALTDMGHIQVDDFQRTTVAGIYAVGDNTTPMRSVSAAVAAGTKAGAVLNKELVDADF